LYGTRDQLEPEYVSFSFSPQEATEGRYNMAHGGIIIPTDCQHDLVAQGVMFHRATSDMAKGVLAQGILGFYFTCAYFCFGSCLFLLCTL